MCYYDEKYDEKWTTVEIYKDLLKRRDENGENFPFEQDNHGMWGELTEEEQEEIKRQVVKAIQESRQAGVGVIDGVERLYKDLVEPKLPWQELIVPTVISFRSKQKSWRRFNRRYTHQNMHLPWYGTSSSTKFMLALDVSGSITEEDIKIFMSEMYSIFELLEDFECYVLCFHHQVEEKSLRKYTKGDPTDYQIIGCGGTNIGCVTDFVFEKEIELDQMFVFTDCYSSTWCDSSEFPVMYISTTDTAAPTSSGETIHYHKE